MTIYFSYPTTAYAEVSLFIPSNDYAVGVGSSAFACALIS
jgi:hypothetical protein